MQQDRKSMAWIHDCTSKERPYFSVKLKDFVAETAGAGKEATERALIVRTPHHTSFNFQKLCVFL